MLTSVDRLLFVRKIPIFQELREDFLVRLASVMEELSFAAGQAIFTQGEEGRSLYILISGRVKVHVGDRELTRLEQGAFFGEMAVFDAEPRSASVTAVDSSECLVLTQQQLYEALEETPSISVNIIRFLSGRIRDLNRQLNALEGE
jgi:CRP-like cAMP-binding protein